MAEPEIAFGIRRVRTSAITHSATKMTTAATVRDCINSLHFSVQRRPDVRGAAVRPPLSRFHPDTWSGLGQDAALSITFWALLQSVPTSLAITIAAAAAIVPITARAMPYSARSWPASSATNLIISAVMFSSFPGSSPDFAAGPRCVPARSSTHDGNATTKPSQLRRGGVDHLLSPTPQRADIAGDDDGYDNRNDADGRQGNPVLREILGGLLAKQPPQKIQHPSPSRRTHPN